MATNNTGGTGVGRASRQHDDSDTISTLSNITHKASVVKTGEPTSPFKSSVQIYDKVGNNLSPRANKGNSAAKENGKSLAVKMPTKHVDNKKSSDAASLVVEHVEYEDDEQSQATYVDVEEKPSEERDYSHYKLKQSFDGGKSNSFEMNEGNKAWGCSKKRLLILFALLVLFAFVIGMATGISRKNKTLRESPTTSANTSEPTPPTMSQNIVATTSRPTAKPTASPITGSPTAKPTTSPTERPVGYLETPLYADRLVDGIMFNVKAAEESDITITSIDLHMDSIATNIPVEVLWVESPYKGWELYPHVWRSDKRYIVSEGKGSGELTPISADDFAPIKVKAGKTVGIYVLLSGGKKMLAGTVGDVEVMSDNYVSVESGVEVPNRFKSMSKGVSWSGGIHYTVG